MIKGTSIFPLYIFHTLIVIFQALPFQTCPSVFALIIKIHIQLNYNDCGYLSIKFQISVAQIKTRMNFITVESFAVATMTWLTVMEYMCHKWPRICSTRRKHFPVLSSFMTYPFGIFKLFLPGLQHNGATSGAGTVYPFGAPEFTLGF